MGCRLSGATRTTALDGPPLRPLGRCGRYAGSRPQLNGSIVRRTKPMKSLQDLLSDDPAWPLVREWIAAASNRVEVLPAREPDRSRALEESQVTTRSPMGALVYETGGLLIDGGWIRVLGSGHPRVPRTLPGWNKGRTWIEEQSAPPLLVVADDVVGGSFAINGGALDGPPGQVHYFAPDRLAWVSLDKGYSEFLAVGAAGRSGKILRGAALAGLARGRREVGR